MPDADEAMTTPPADIDPVRRRAKRQPQDAPLEQPAAQRIQTCVSLSSPERSRRARHCSNGLDRTLPLPRAASRQGQFASLYSLRVTSYLQDVYLEESCCCRNARGCGLEYAS